MAGAESSDFSAIIMLCDSVACPEGKLYIQGGGWQTLQSDRYPVRIPRIGVAVIVTVPYARTTSATNCHYRSGTVKAGTSQSPAPTRPPSLQPARRAGVRLAELLQHRQAAVPASR